MLCGNVKAGERIVKVLCKIVSRAMKTLSMNFYQKKNLIGEIDRKNKINKVKS